jgi:N-acetylglucosaminyl-diphospho-decaprenol L-rhamnosyltransferase
VTAVSGEGESGGPIGGIVAQAGCDSPSGVAPSFDVPILIVSYSRPQDVAACLRALSRMATEPRFEVFIAENGGPAAFDALVSELIADAGPCVDTTPEDANLGQLIAARHRRLRLLRDDGATGHHVRVAEMPENLGYAGGVNAWLRPLLQINGWQGAWILNPDTEPEPTALAELVEYAAAYGKSLVGSRLVFKTDQSSVQTRGLSWRRWRSTVEGIDKLASSEVTFDISSVENRLDAPSGASTYATRDLVENIGLMHEHYFLYFEDLEWGVRAKKHGRLIGYAHSSIVRHQGGSTIGSAQLRRERSRLSVYLDIRNRVLFVREHHPIWLPWSVAVCLADTLAYAAAGSVPNAAASLLGLTAAMAGQAGRPASFAKLTQPWRFEMPGKRRIKILVSAVFWTGLISWRLLARLLRVDRSLVILYYHGVASADRGNFARQLSNLAKHADVVPADFVDDGAVGRRRVAITFDDGLTSVAENALPELLRREMPCTIFFPSGALGRVPDWETEAEHDTRDAVMSAQVVKDLPNSLVTVGSHSVSHPRLPNISIETASRELAESKASLEQLTGRTVSLFAFPYGDFDDTILRRCGEAGYLFAYSVNPRIVDLRSKGILRGRISVGPEDGPVEFYLKSSGAYAWVAVLAWVRHHVRSLFSRGRRDAGVKALRSRSAG